MFICGMTAVLALCLCWRSKFVSDNWMMENGFIDPPSADKKWYVYWCCYFNMVIVIKDFGT